MSLGRAIIQAGWDDAPWLSDEVKAEMLASTPPHLREARSKGIPGLGSGAVYPISVDDIKVDPFEIPAHYRKMYALDVGWNKTAALLAAVDPDTDTIYIVAEHYMGDARPEIHAAALKSWGEWIPGVIDPASRGRSQVDGQKLMQIYKQIGLRIKDAKNQVEAGLYYTWDRLSCGKIKVFSNLSNFFSEYIIYRRDINGKIIKEKDHLMDCLRYIVLNINNAQAKPVRGTGPGADNFGESYGIRKYQV